MSEVNSDNRIAFFDVVERSDIMESNSSIELPVTLDSDGNIIDASGRMIAEIYSRIDSIIGKENRINLCQVSQNSGGRVPEHRKLGRFIVDAINSHQDLKKRVEELEQQSLQPA